MNFAIQDQRITIQSDVVRTMFVIDTKARFSDLIGTECSLASLDEAGWWCMMMVRVNEGAIMKHWI